jgi:hypothetical protein
MESMIQVIAPIMNQMQWKPILGGISRNDPENLKVNFPLNALIVEK